MRRDYRWDRQVDERAVYLARLVLDVELSIDPIVEQLWRTGRNTGYDGNRFGQSVDVLAALARIPVTAAVDALREYVGEGERWVEVLQAVAGTWPGEWWDDLAPIDVPSASWRCPSLSYRDAPVAGLLSLLADPDTSSETLSAVPTSWPSARTCGGSDWSTRSRNRTRGTLPSSLWHRSPHSYERAAYVNALLTLDPDTTRQQLPDALADCEGDVRMAAARHAPLTGEVRRRLGRLRDSPIENTDVRAAAAERLASV
ncbi:hypothetical protein H4696_001082 [Amycolatopsis lexingtonensis]|uniref:HEAT repeat domain-containing protein n=1 Tax=Amycolatopsis lexingtonensis TaxID=218822 RepID=A0ABR9HSS9_9PSEU|nr:hypothetical protein [Amycolatopsis lexingtonensis]MBE1493982.1 hypothetical protein [Amycolatopsis lexingtonensis]